MQESLDDQIGGAVVHLSGQGVTLVLSALALYALTIRSSKTSDEWREAELFRIRQLSAEVYRLSSEATTP